jgi:hypothetical protein
MNSIDITTQIPLFAIIGSIPVIAGFVFWLSSVAFSARAAEKKIAEIEIKQDHVNNMLLSIKEDLTLVKYKLDIKGGNNGSIK